MSGKFHCEFFRKNQQFPIQSNLLVVIGRAKRGVSVEEWTARGNAGGGLREWLDLWIIDQVLSLKFGLRFPGVTTRFPDPQCTLVQVTITFVHVSLNYLRILELFTR